MTEYNLRSIVRVTLAKDNFMDTGDLDQLEKQLHELLLICVNLRRENEALKKMVSQQSTELNTLSQERKATEERVSYLLTRLVPSEPQDE